MDDLHAAASLCEDRGFPKQAELLRSLAGGPAAAFLVVPTLGGMNADVDSILMECPHLVFPHREPRAGGAALFLDRKAATARAVEWEARLLIGPQCPYPSWVAFGDLTRLGPEEFCDQVGAILGRPYRLSGVGGLPTFPGEITPRQFKQILKLLRFRYYGVRRVPLWCAAGR